MYPAQPILRHTKWVFVLAAIIAVLAVIAINASRPTDRIDSVSGAVTESRSPTDTDDAVLASLPASDQSSITEPRPETLTADTPLDLYGIGPIEAGMTLGQAERVSGVNLIPAGFNNDNVETSRCFSAYAEGLKEDFVLLVTGPASGGEHVPVDRPEDGIIRAVAAGEDTQTLSGIERGDTEDDVYATYGDRIESGPPLFNRSRLHFLTFIPPHPADQDYRVRFKTDGNVVQAIYAGYEDSTHIIEGFCN